VGRIKVVRKTGYYSKGYKVDTDQLERAIVKAKDAPLEQIPSGKVETVKENKYAKLVKVVGYNESAYGFLKPEFYLVVKQRKRPSYADAAEDED